MKHIKFDSDTYKQLQQIRKKDYKLFKRIQKQLNLFKQNPKSKSLRLHKVIREVKNSWSVSINKSFRILYTETDTEYYFYKMGTHDEVYRK